MRPGRGPFSERLRRPPHGGVILGAKDSVNEGPAHLSEARVRAALARSPLARLRGAREAAERLCAETAERLFDHLDPVRLEPRWVVDLVMQCGLEDRLSQRYPESRVVSCGYCPGASVTGLASRALAVAASPVGLPLATGSADLVVSNLGMCWFADLGPVFREIRRVLRPGGLIAFATLGAGTLAELRRSWESVDDRSHIIDFIDLHDVGDAMVNAGFADVVMDAERITVTWPDVPALLHDLRGLGTGNPLPRRPPGLTTPRWLESLVAAYEGRVPSVGVAATVELVHGHGWTPEGRAEVPLEAFARPR